jgi:phage gp29-like protein
VGKDLFRRLDETIPRHESGQGYVRVVEHSVMWNEKEVSKVCTYQGLTTCTEDDRSPTIMSSAYNHVRSKRGEDERSMVMWKEKEASKIFTYQGLTTCTEVDRSWTIHTHHAYHAGVAGVSTAV